jgi:hypothetical protein
VKQGTQEGHPDGYHKDFRQILSSAISRTMQQKIHLTRPDAKPRSMAMVQAESYMDELNAQGMLDYGASCQGTGQAMPGQCSGVQASASPRDVLHYNQLLFLKRWLKVQRTT